jgi:hypothetical protein
MTAKYGIPYFANFINSDMKPEDVRSMCCRLRLNTKELRRRGGGLFGANPLTGCYDESTEILTLNGWKPFKELTTEDIVYTLSPDNKILLQKVARVYTYDYEGQMYHFKNDSLDLVVTPDHWMVVDTCNNIRKFVRAKDFNGNSHRIPKRAVWQGVEKEFFELPPVPILGGKAPLCLKPNATLNERLEKIKKRALKQCVDKVAYKVFTGKERDGWENTRIRRVTRPLRIKMDDWLAFFGIWLAEGSTDNEKNAESHGYRVEISQRDEKKRKEIEELLNRLPFNYDVTEKSFIIYSKQLWSYLRQFGNAYTKFIPQEIKQLSRRQLKILFDWMVKGDGQVRTETGQVNYWTASKRLADDLQEIALKLGWLAVIREEKKKVSKINGREIRQKHTNYNVSFHIKTRHFRLRENNIEKVYYKGKVYCAEVPEHHTLYVRRNGKPAWSGNSVGVVTINLPRMRARLHVEGRGRILREA